VSEKQEYAFDTFCRIFGAILLGLLGAAPFAVVGTFAFLYGVLWGGVLISGWGTSCDELPVGAALAGIAILGLGFFVLGWLVFRAIALHRGFSAWGFGFLLLFLFLVAGLPLAYADASGATCDLHR